MSGYLVLINHHLPPGHRLAGGLVQDGAVRDAVGGGGCRHGQERDENKVSNFLISVFPLITHFNSTVTALHLLLQCGELDCFHCGDNLCKVTLSAIQLP